MLSQVSIKTGDHHGIWCTTQADSHWPSSTAKHNNIMADARSSGSKHYYQDC